MVAIELVQTNCCFGAALKEIEVKLEEQLSKPPEDNHPPIGGAATYSGRVRHGRV